MTGETWLNTESITSTGWTNNPFTVQKNEWEVYYTVLVVVTAQAVLGILLQTVLWVCLQKRIFMSNKSSYLDLQYCIRTCVYLKLARLCEATTIMKPEPKIYLNKRTVVNFEYSPTSISPEPPLWFRWKNRLNLLSKVFHYILREIWKNINPRDRVLQALVNQKLVMSLVWIFIE